MRNAMVRFLVPILLLLPISAAAGVIQYDAVTVRYTASTSVTNATTGVSDTNNASIALTPSPPNASVSSALGPGSSSVDIAFNLDQAANTFSYDTSIGVTSDLTQNILGLATTSIRVFIDFTLESSDSDFLELMISVDSLMSGLDEMGLANFNSSLLTPVVDGQFNRPIANATTDSTLVLQTGQSHTLLIEFDFFGGGVNGAARFVDGRSALTTSLSVLGPAPLAAPEPPLLGAFGIAFMLLLRRRFAGQATESSS